MSYDQLPVLGDNPQGSFPNVKDRLVDADKNVITDIDMWQLTASATEQTGSNILISNWDRSTTTSLKNPVYKGSGLNAPISGNFSFTSTGIWKINAQVTLSNVLGSYGYFYINSTNDGTNYTRRAFVIINPATDIVISTDTIFNVTNTANDKFNIQVVTPSSTYAISGSTTAFYTGVTAMKIGEV